MVNIISKTCIHENCKIRPTFNYENEKIRLYCFKHKLDNMVNIINKKCIHENCKIRPTFNYKNETKALYCFKHKLDNMVNITHKKCFYDNCNRQPIYNYENKNKGLYCFKHKLDNMVDIKNKTCIHKICNIQPTFNYKNKTKALYCFKHKLDNMVNITHKKCIHINCNIQPTYNYKNEKIRLYCFKHKLDNMVDIKNKTCKNEWCNIVVTKKYKGYCLNCFIHEFPNEKVARNYKTKETHITNYIKEYFNNYDLVCDKTIQNGCSKKRPDILLDLGFQVIIVEIDENQHKNYDCSCENKRLMELSKDIGHRPIIFIRFNPDDYKDGDKNITSCFGVNKLGICVVKKNKEKELNERLINLKEQIEYWIENKTNKTIEIIQLYYDK